jgi:hypothetical protein
VVPFFDFEQFRSESGPSRRVRGRGRVDGVVMITRGSARPVHDQWRPTQVEAFPTLREHYLGVIAKPMDLGLINHNFVNDEYEGREQFVEDLRLVFSNAVEFNRPAAQQAQSQKELNPHFVMDDLAAKTYAIATHLLNYVDHLELEYFKDDV